MKRIFFFLIIIFGSFNVQAQDFSGIWQPSYAYNGKIPWYIETLVIDSKYIKFQTKGVVSETWDILVLNQLESSTHVDILASQGDKKSVFRFEMNSKYKCTRKSKFSYDWDCTNHDQKSPFRLLICSSSTLETIDASSCKVRERYFDLHPNQLEQVQTGDYL